MDSKPLFAPFTCKSLQLKNRFVMPPMTRKHSPDGVPSGEVADYYARRATDAGLILSESTAINRPASKHFKDIPDFHGAGLKGWKNVIDTIHLHQGNMGPQLWHVGMAKPDPSGWLPNGEFEGPANMSADAIQATIKAFASAAYDAKQMGFNCVEIHGGHGYLIDQFFWDRTNQRRDEYGGKTIKERSRFAADVIRAIRSAVGPDFVIIIRISQWKLQDYEARLASSPKELERWLSPLCDAGVDMIDCSQRRFWQAEFDGSDLSFAGWAKKISGKPTITVGSVGLSGEFLKSLFNREGAGKSGLEDLMRRFDQEEFDLVAVGRPLLQDPNWISKVRAEKYDEVQDFSRESLDFLF